jgi:hypothetical protein
MVMVYVDTTTTIGFQTLVELKMIEASTFPGDRCGRKKFKYGILAQAVWYGSRLMINSKPDMGVLQLSLRTITAHRGRVIPHDRSLIAGI